LRGGKRTVPLADRWYGVADDDLAMMLTVFLG
jgi:hypothetical protein